MLDFKRWRLWSLIGRFNQNCTFSRWYVLHIRFKTFFPSAWSKKRSDESYSFFSEVENNMGSHFPLCLAPVFNLVFQVSVLGFGGLSVKTCEFPPLRKSSATYERQSRKPLLSWWRVIFYVFIVMIEAIYIFLRFRKKWIAKEKKLLCWIKMRSIWGGATLQCYHVKSNNMELSPFFILFQADNSQFYINHFLSDTNTYHCMTLDGSIRKWQLYAVKITTLSYNNSFSLHTVQNKMVVWLVKQKSERITL